MMMKKLILLIILFFSLIQKSFACMPFSYSEIIIGTYEWTEIKTHPSWNKLDFIYISNTKKPLVWNYNKIWKYYFVAHDNDRRFSFSNYKRWDLVIMIADSNNWNYEDYFAVYELGKLVRKTNWELDIVNMQWYIKDWGKSMWQCWSFKPDDVMDKEKLLYKISYFLDVWVPLYQEKMSINFILISWFFLFLAGVIFILFKIKK